MPPLCKGRWVGHKVAEPVGLFFKAHGCCASTFFCGGTTVTRVKNNYNGTGKPVPYNLICVCLTANNMMTPHQSPAVTASPQASQGEAMRSPCLPLEGKVGRPWPSRKRCHQIPEACAPENLRRTSSDPSVSASAASSPYAGEPRGVRQSSGFAGSTDTGRPEIYVFVGAVIRR